MAQVDEGGDREKSHISMPKSNFPRDLLPRFVSVNHFPIKLEEPASEDADADAEDVELSLGLSLNGRFGVDPRAKTKKIKRTSSIPEFAKQVRDEDDVASYAMPMACAPLMRACSLPTETEEEWRKRKELQTLRRMEARRKRSEKQRNLKALRERNRALSEDIDVVDNYNYKRSEEGVEGAATLDEFTPRARGLPPPPSSSKPQGSIASQGISQSECQTAHQGTLSADSASLTGSNRLPNERKLPVTSGTRNAENSDKIGAVTMRNHSSRLASPADRRAKDSGGGSRNLLEDMPSVSTKGEGPNGKRIEGFLYRYRKGEEVRIVCVCHGSFLSPAEFVKHAGGGDVAHPLKHIVVNPSML